MIRTLFPPEVITLEASPEMWEGDLLPEEEECVTRAFPKRRREFTAGRVCARRALEKLGIRDFPLVAGPDRLPLWPAGIVGSISHCRDYCGVAAARRGRILGIGLDVERSGPLEERIIPRLCTDTELAALDASVMSVPDWAKIIFSAKESTYKCYYPIGRTVLGFHDVQIALDPHGSFTARMLRGSEALGDAVMRGRWGSSEKFVLTGVTLTAGDA
jgi:4'-phosphopantetheinyl transferase EntD